MYYGRHRTDITRSRGSAALEDPFEGQGPPDGAPAAVSGHDRGRSALPFAGQSALEAPWRPPPPGLRSSQRQKPSRQPRQRIATDHIFYAFACRTAPDSIIGFPRPRPANFGPGPAPVIPTSTPASARTPAPRRGATSIPTPTIRIRRDLPELIQEHAEGRRGLPPRFCAEGGAGAQTTSTRRLSFDPSGPAPPRPSRRPRDRRRRLDAATFSSLTIHC